MVHNLCNGRFMSLFKLSTDVPRDLALDTALFLVISLPFLMSLLMSLLWTVEQSECRGRGQEMSCLFRNATLYLLVQFLKTHSKPLRGLVNSPLYRALHEGVNLFILLCM